MVNSTLTGTMMPTVPALSADTKMKRISMSTTGATAIFQFLLTKATPQAAEEGGEHLGKGGLQHRGLQNGGQGYNADDTDEDNHGGDDAGHGDGNGGNDLSLLAGGADPVLLQSVQGAGQLQVGDVAGDEAQVGAARSQHGNEGKGFDDAHRPVHGRGGKKSQCQRAPVGSRAEEEGHADGEQDQKQHHADVPDPTVPVDTVHVGVGISHIESLLTPARP